MFSLSFFNFKCVCYKEEKPENSIVNYLKEVFNIPESPVSGPPAPVTEMTRSEPKVEVPEVVPVVPKDIQQANEYKKFENPEEKVPDPENEFVIISTEIGNVTMSPFVYNSTYM